MVECLCNLLEETTPKKQAGVAEYGDLITLVECRPGYDLCYARKVGKVERELGEEAAGNLRVRPAQDCRVVFRERRIVPARAG